jgi:hypothetical protein
VEEMNLWGVVQVPSTVLGSLSKVNFFGVGSQLCTVGKNLTSFCPPTQKKRFFSKKIKFCLYHQIFPCLRALVGEGALPPINARSPLGHV